MKKNLLIATAIIMVALASCSGGGKKNASTSDSTKIKDSIAKLASGGGKYAMKSGIITMVTETMGMKQNMVKYFDDYGKEECIEITGDMNKEMKGSVKMNHTTITKDGYIYNLDGNKKTGTKMAVGSKTSHRDIDFKNMTDEMMKEMNITKGGTETVLGETCDIYKLDDPKMQMKATYYVWDGIPLKSEIDMHGMKATVTTTKIEENASIPADKFAIPGDYKITESSGMKKKMK